MSNEHHEYDLIVTELHDLQEAVNAFLDQYYCDDYNGDRPSWPTELQDLVGWHEDERIKFDGQYASPVQEDDDDE